MNDNKSIASMFVAGILIGAGVTFFPLINEISDKNKTLANLEAEEKSKPVITVEGLGICQVHQGGKVYMLVDITKEMQANQATDEIGLEEKHNQLMESYEEAK